MKNILVLEDDNDLRSLYHRALKFKGYDVTATESAERAIDLLQKGALVPDVAVLDMSMPGLPGSAVVEFIRNHSQHATLPIIVITCDERFKEHLKTAGVVFMTKPINLHDLYVAVARAVS
ncbi:MAG: response regulator [Anaerolineae bacterium]|nr:response regulator [Anaerolineae bacterium]